MGEEGRESIGKENEAQYQIILRLFAEASDNYINLYLPKLGIIHVSIRTNTHIRGS